MHCDSVKTVSLLDSGGDGTRQRLAVHEAALCGSLLVTTLCMLCNLHASQIPCIRAAKGWRWCDGSRSIEDFLFVTGSYGYHS